MPAPLTVPTPTTTTSKPSSPPTIPFSNSTSYAHNGASPPFALPSRPLVPTQWSSYSQTSVPASAPFPFGQPGTLSNNPIYDNPATRTSHISSTIRQAPRGHQPKPSFEAASLPRTSSLLPPPNLTPQSGAGPPSQLQQAPVFRDPFGGSAYTGGGFTAAAPFNAARKESDAASSRRPSRSSSVGKLSEGFRNLNRWSASTASSRGASPPASRKGSLGRRLSVDTIALQAQDNATYTSLSAGAQQQFQYPYQQQYQQPRKLQKPPPYPPSGLNPAANQGSPARLPARTPPPASLPPIVPLPSLGSEVREASPLAAGLPERQWTPSTLRGQPATSGQARDARPVTPAETVLSTKVEVNGSPTADDPNMSYNGYVSAQQSSRGHSRNRSQNAKGSGDSSSSRNSKQPSQKAMLSKALQKANIAVQLDNAGNVGAARESYGEACELLHQVLVRTAGEEDKRKLEAIKHTYTVRIEELDRIAPQRRPENRPLPSDPPEAEILYRAARDEVGGNASGAVFGKPTPARVPQADSYERRPSIPNIAPVQSGGYDQSYNSLPTVTSRYNVTTPGASSTYTAQSSFSRPAAERNPSGLTLQPPSTNQYIPAPLSPRRPLSPTKPPPDRELPQEPSRLGVAPVIDRQNDFAGQRGHRRGASNGSVSWLDPIDESGGSAASSVHSRSSSMNIRRKHVRMASGDTEAAFDAALDDAIEAAYDEGYEPDDTANTYQEEESSEDIVAKALRKVEVARERVRATQQEALMLANERERRLREALEMQEDDDVDADEDESGPLRSQGSGVFYDGDDSEEEERMLEEMTTGYAIEDFSFKPATQGRPPRASDSSEMTSRTWHSSMGSNPPTATTMLSAVSENTIVPGFTKGPPDALPPPPTGSLPPPPQRRGTGPLPGLGESPPKESVRSRRLSGQNPKQLKIETAKVSKPTAPAPGVPASAIATTAPSQLKSGGYIAQQRQALSAGPNRTAGPFARSPNAFPSPNEAAPPTPPLPPGTAQDGENRSGSPSVSRPGLRKNFSSSSLRSMKSRNMSVSALDDASDMSPATPMSNQFAAANAKLPALPSLPTPVAAAFKERLVSAGGTGGLYLFDGDFHSPNSPGSPNPLSSDAPVSLEPCPSDTMLRPFWLMRCIYQTLSHPRGGYISNKLFVPRDVWKVKGVKLKNVEDKVANCDFLTAALLKLAKVDTFDADAVLDEMQSLEVVLEQVQTALTRRLGNEVGVHSSTTMFKDASPGPDDAAAGSVPRSASVSAKSSFSWRRLRSKNSSAGLQSAYAGNARKDSVTEGGAKEGATLASLPMTSQPTSRPTKRDVASVQFSGPNANYMAALARLMDAAQTIDQIARQVEDPGLRHADKTQVGLELCTRHAAEFFAFYVCRFVLSDLALLLDKFVKRGSEWVIV